MAGCQTHLLGSFDYCFVASKEFIKHYFKTNRHKENLRTAPALIFDKHDKLHQSFTEKFFSLNEPPINFHLIPSVQGFKQFALHGFGCGLLPQIDISDELKHKNLIEVFPEKRWKMPIYWHSWAIESDIEKQFREYLLGIAEKQLM